MPQICVWRFCRCFLKSVVPPEFPLRGDTLPGNVGWTATFLSRKAGHPGAFLSVPREGSHQSALSLGRGNGGTPPVHGLYYFVTVSRFWGIVKKSMCCGICFRTVKMLFSGVFLVHEYRIGDFGGWIRGLRTGDLLLFFWRHQIIPVHFACFNPAAYVSDIIHCVA